jgi:hypothetical protein
MHCGGEEKIQCLVSAEGSLCLMSLAKKNEYRFAHLENCPNLILLQRAQSEHILLN